MYSIVLLAALATTPSTPAWCHGCCHGGWGCHGCCSCYGGWGCCHGGYSWGCRGCCSCYGGWSCGGCYSGCYSGWSCHGCYSGGYAGCWSCYSGCYAAAPAYTAPVMAGAPAAPTATVAAPSNTARLVVEVPADARLYIDGQLTRTSADKRSFSTPRLDPGYSYYYELKAEVVRAGKTYTEEKRVTVRANETTRTTFAELANAGKSGNPVASAR